MFQKLKIHTKRLIYRLKNDLLTTNNVVFFVAIAVALSWTWSSVETMQQNYQLQQSVDRKKQQVTLEQLHVDTLELEGKYYKTLEYQELAVRQRLGKGMPGEKALIVPSTDIEQVSYSPGIQKNSSQSSNFQEWVDFLFGKRSK